jgi:alkaline phosphatase D
LPVKKPKIHPTTIFLLVVLSGFLTLQGRCDSTVSRLAFGSCCKQDKPIPILDSVIQFEPEVWIWMGDNVYADTVNMDKMAKKYAKLLENRSYSRLRGNCRIIGTWDDHDYGENDAGRDYSKREASQQLFLDFMEVPDDDPRRDRAGVYSSHTFGPAKSQIKIILLDTRYHRDEPGPDGDILGPAQWEWLEQELTNSTAQVHLVVSSIQVVASEHKWEKWANFPAAHTRLFALLNREDVPPVTFLSGDRHLGEISADKTSLSYPIFDITSSSLNKPIGEPREELNRHRVGENFVHSNFGTLEVDWDATPPLLRFALRDEEGQEVRTVEFQQAR